jgi:hypothetical protein
MTNALKNIDRLRRFVASKHPPESDTYWIAQQIEVYLDANGKLSLEQASGIATKPGTSPWWHQEALRARNQAIERLGDLTPGPRLASRARRIVRSAECYQSAPWQFDQACEVTNYSDSLRKCSDETLMFQWKAVVSKSVSKKPKRS